MSSTSVSSVNKYLLGTKGGSTELGTNITFPSNFNGLQTAFNQSSLKTYNDCRYNFTVSGDGDAYKNDDYELLASSYSYASSSKPWLQHAPPHMFNSDPESGSQLNLWAGGGAYSSVNNLGYYLDGVFQGNFNVTGVYRGTGDIYTGGGVGHYFTTIHNSGSVDGLWFQMKFPFKVKMNNIQIKGRDNNPSRGPEQITVLGSDDGSTWTFIQHLTFASAYTNGAFQQQNISTSKRFLYIRFVITHTKGNDNLNIRQVLLNFDTWSKTSSTE